MRWGSRPQCEAQFVFLEYGGKNDAFKAFERFGVERMLEPFLPIPDSAGSPAHADTPIRSRPSAPLQVHATRAWRTSTAGETSSHQRARVNGRDPRSGHLW